jgi:adenylate kinase family enzyme
MKTLVVNLFGGPGTGKSTLCANIFAKLKISGIDVEMAPEYVKEVVWEESFKKIDNQIYIFGKQHNRIHRLLGKVQVVITDSPLLNSIVYYNGINEYFDKLVVQEHNNMNNLSFYLNRGFDYVQNGRMQTIEKAIQIDEKFKEVLNENKIDYTDVKGPYDIDELVGLILEKIEYEQ